MDPGLNLRSNISSFCFSSRQAPPLGPWGMLMALLAVNTEDPVSSNAITFKFSAN